MLRFYTARRAALGLAITCAVLAGDLARWTRSTARRADGRQLI